MDYSALRKSSIKNLSLFSKGRYAKDFLKDSLNGATATTFLFGGGRYDTQRISAFQSSKAQSGCEDCHCEDRFSLQIQYQLPYHLDTEIQEEAVGREGG
jgi:hypothetical protein